MVPLMMIPNVRQEYDEGRTIALESSDGLRLVRFFNESVLKRPDVVLKQIHGYLSNSTFEPPSP